MDTDSISEPVTHLPPINSTWSPRKVPCQGSGQAASARALQVPVEVTPERCENCSSVAVNRRISERGGDCVQPRTLPCDVLWTTPSREGHALLQVMCHNTPDEQGHHQESAWPQLSLQHTLSPKTHNTVPFSACSLGLPRPQHAQHPTFILWQRPSLPLTCL